MNLNVLKLIYLLIMIAGTLVAGLLPMKVLRYLRHSAANAASSQQHKHVSLVLCLLTCFSGGVFLATCFLHLFPELVEHVADLGEVYGWSVDYPLAELISCLGFFFLFFLEEIVITAIPSMAHGHSHGHGGHSHQEHDPLTAAPQDSGCCMTGVYVPSSTTEETHFDSSTKRAYSGDDTKDAMLESAAQTLTTMSEEEVAGHCQKHCPLTVHHVRRNSGRETPECTAPTDKNLLLPPTAHGVRPRSYGYVASDGCGHPHGDHLHANPPPLYRRCQSEGAGVFTALAVAEPERCETNCEKIDEDPPILMKSSPHAHSHGVRSITLVLALSIHSVIEGIAFGVGDNAADTSALFVSLLVHKLIVAFSVGLQLARTHAHQLRWVVASMFILALMSPLGALIGMALQSATEQSFAKDFTIMILQGLAVGTFLYVTFFEVLLHERDNEHPNLLKLLVMVIGFGLIGLLRLVDNHDHGVAGGGGHGHSHDGKEMLGLANATAEALSMAIGGGH